MNKELGDKDLVLFNQWKESGEKDKKAFTALVNNMKPLVMKEVNALSGSLPQSALKGEAISWTIKAIKDYDPSKGAKLSTHVYSWLRKTKRLNYTHQNMANMGEDKQLQYGKFNIARSNLEDELDRTPTSEELGKALGWSTKEVDKYQGLLFQDHIESGNKYDNQHSTFNEDPLKLNYIKSKLNPEELTILEDRANKISANDIAKKLNMNINQYNYSSSKLKEKIQGLIQDYGTWDN